MKTVGNGVKTKYYKSKFIPLDCDERIFIKFVKRHWWNIWEPITINYEDKTYMLTYVRDEMTMYFKPNNGIYWNEETGLK